MDFKNLFKRLYQYSLFLKGADGIFEFFSGIFLLFFSFGDVVNFLSNLFSHELIEDPHDFVANFLIHAFEFLPSGMDYFWAIYLFMHGVIKIGLVWGLLEEKRWVYPWAIGILGLFIIYQIYLVIADSSIFYIALTLIDLIIISFIIWDYKKLISGKVKI